MLIKFKTFHSLLQVKLIEIVERHQMPISSKDQHLSIINSHTLSITSARFFSYYVSVAFVIDYFLFKLFIRRLLITDCL